MNNTVYSTTWDPIRMFCNILICSPKVQVNCTKFVCKLQDCVTLVCVYVQHLQLGRVARTWNSPIYSGCTCFCIHTIYLSTQFVFFRRYWNCNYSYNWSSGWSYSFIFNCGGDNHCGNNSIEVSIVRRDICYISPFSC